MHLEKTWIAIDKLSIICKADLSNKIKQDFFQTFYFVNTIARLHHMDADKTYREKAKRKIHNKLYWTNTGSNTPRNNACMASYLPSLNPFQLDEQDMRDTAGDARTNS